MGVYGSDPSASYDILAFVAWHPRSTRYRRLWTAPDATSHLSAFRTTRQKYALHSEYDRDTEGPELKHVERHLLHLGAADGHVPDPRAGPDSRLRDAPQDRPGRRGGSNGMGVHGARGLDAASHVRRVSMRVRTKLRLDAPAGWALTGYIASNKVSAPAPVHEQCWDITHGAHVARAAFLTVLFLFFSGEHSD